MEQELVGILHHDRKNWSAYVQIDGRYVKNWIWDRFRELPEGALVKVSVEVLDPHPTQK